MRQKHPTNQPFQQMLPALLLTACILLSACSSIQGRSADQATAASTVTTANTATSAPTDTLTPFQYMTATLTSTPTPLPTATSTPSPTAPPTETPEEGFIPAGQAMVPILLYHHISDEGSSRYFVHLKDFRAQMKMLSEAGYQTINISRLAEVIRNGGALPPKAVVLTFDDGFEDTYQNALPILSEYGFSGVAYIITGTIGTNLAYGYMQEDELKGLVAAGWEIGSHSITHSDLATSKLGMGVELAKSKKDLETLLGTPIRTFSYPYGTANAWTQTQPEKYGYDSAVGLGTQDMQTINRLYYLSRREVYHSTSLEAFRALLTPDKEELLMLQLTTQTPIVTPIP